MDLPYVNNYFVYLAINMLRNLRVILFFKYYLTHLPDFSSE